MCHDVIGSPAAPTWRYHRFFSPSSAATAWAPNRFARAKAFLEGQGFRLKAGSLTGQQDNWRSGSIAARAEELNALIRDPEVRCIMSVIGGSNSNSLLPYLDFDALRRDPKIIVGYSDVTALLLGIHAQTGLVTFMARRWWPPLASCRRWWMRRWPVFYRLRWPMKLASPARCPPRQSGAMNGWIGRTRPGPSSASPIG